MAVVHGQLFSAVFVESLIATVALAPEQGALHYRTAMNESADVPLMLGSPQVVCLDLLSQVLSYSFGFNSLWFDKYMLPAKNCLIGLLYIW